MPYYEFTCDTCQITRMVVLRMTDDKQQTCLDCHQPMRRSYTSPATIFKGSGFYTTDKRK